MNNIISVSTKDDVTVVRVVANKLDANNAPSVEGDIRELLLKNLPKVVLDLSLLTYISSAGIRAVLLFARETLKRKGKFAVVITNEEVKGVFITSFDTLFDIHSSIDSAMKKM